MIYFLVNNDYHFNLDEKLASNINGHKLGLIQIPYSLKLVSSSTVFDKIITFHDKLNTSLKWMLFNFGANRKLLKKINNELDVDLDDILLVHTEIDMLNQYIISKFYNAGAKVFLIEDGTATMSLFNMTTGKVANKDRIRSLMLKYCYGFSNFEFKKYGVETLAQMEDHIFRGLIVKRGDKINRDIPIYKLAPFLDQINIIHKNGAIFFSQGLYLFFMSEDEYIKLVDRFLEISNFFSPFYFKFHPSDSEYVKKKLVGLIESKYRNVDIILENDIAENLINKYPVGYAITFNSTAVFNILEKGIVPIFLNKILNEFFPDDSFVAFGQFLSSINCNVPANIEEINPDFVAFKDEMQNSNTYKLIDILEL